MLRTAPRGVVGFEVILGAYSPLSMAAMVISIAGGVEQGHGLFGEVAAVAGDPFVVHVDQDRADESDHGGGVGEDPHDPGCGA